MTWESRIITDDALTAYAREPLTDLPVRVPALIQQQLATWPMLRNATEALAQVQYREFDVKGSRVLAQFNPARIVSTAAKVDTASIQARPCFLCAENLPAEEKGVLFGNNYVVLCNPFPVLEDHLVISEQAHTPQAIAPRFTDLLELTQAMGSEYFTLYNGPACGASAPDHHHFQACSRKNIPLFTEVENWPRDYVLRESDLEVFTLHDYRLNILVASGSKMDTIATWFHRSLHRLASLTAATAEPLLNLVVTYDPHHWMVYLFPRKKHRPACYYAEGEEKLTISPAGIDLTGVLVVPDPHHFARLTAPHIAQIYEEITLAPFA
ncbi:MAG: DUF4922 domain-containing protein [Acidobacteria bacterium]|nr:DUF4922 domain-containing protein [Acidobacteriota bacterium]